MSDEYWMERCLQLAATGKGLTSPNPLVGAVIVKNGKVLGEGFHKRYGGPHAEINAINAVKDKTALKGSTIYINLEPCFHYGNTPPCVDEILRHGFSRVVITRYDPNPLVKGKSVAKLRRHGVQCDIGILRRQGDRCNEKYNKFISTGLPFIALKAAQTSDGYIARSDGTSKWITTSASRKFVHALRNEYDAVLVGAGTVTADDPRLTVRSVRGRNPVRIVVDGNLSVSGKKKIFNDEASTIVYTSKELAKEKRRAIQRLESKGVVVVTMSSKRGRIDPRRIAHDLARHNISSVLIEGGQQLYAEFLNAGIVDKMYLFTAAKRFHGGVSLFGGVRRPFVARIKHSLRFGNDIMDELYFTERSS
jgi:diaminohydroxyphosphoribosylaminopyrimidine deaminase/5-amino-6-(5-phosphoribosylamino)uracil reductase